jgi:hypothetical protein
LSANEPPSEDYLYRAERDGYRLEVFPRASATAGVRLSHQLSDTSLRFALTGTANSRTASGSMATADLIGLTARWHSMTDRLKEELLLRSRPPNDEIVFELDARGLALAPDEEGGFAARDRSGTEIFRILRPTAIDGSGQRGTASLIVDGTRATIRLSAPFAASAAYPITVDPTVIYTEIGRRSVGFANSTRLLEDAFGKLLLVGWGGGRNITGAWSNDGGARWFSQVTEDFGVSSDAAPSWIMAADGTGLHMVCRCGGEAIQYGRWTIERDAINDISALRPPASLLTLSDAVDRTIAGMPSLVLDRNGLPAVAWTQTRMTEPRGWAVAFLRAKADPTIRENWVNAEGTGTSPDLLGPQAGAPHPPAAATLVRMPADAPATENDDALYLFWIDPVRLFLRWSRAQIQGPDYTAWTRPVDKGAAFSGGALLPASAADMRHRGIVVAWPASAGRWRIERKSAADDRDAADVVVADGTVTFDRQLSLGVDRGDVYAAYSKGDEIALRSYEPERGWGAERVLAYAGSDSHPTIRSYPADGFVDVAWANVGGPNPAVRHVRVRASRPVVQGLVASPSTFDPLTGGSTSFGFTLADDASPTLSLRAEISDSQGAVVRRMGDEAAPVGARQLVWDGRNDRGETQPNGAYTLRIRVIDRDGVASPDHATSVVIGTVVP